VSTPASLLTRFPTVLAWSPRLFST